ncbi:UNVERIFIED_CONTAM: hypothetical protein O1L43_32285, partial [Pseudomonas aeruginosa]
PRSTLLASSAASDVYKRQDERLRTGATSWLAGLPFHDRFVLGFGHTVTVDKQRGCYLGGEGA